jgi:hypothetical protein
VLFIVLYIVATLFYPGGSEYDRQAKGFSWLHNYWCNLLNEYGVNGEPNVARPIAITALITLAFSLTAFWYIFPRFAPFTKTARLIIQLSGFLSMAIGAFLSTPLHDLIINLSTLMGLVAMTGTFIGLYKLRLKVLFWMGLFILVLIGLNNLFYYGGALLYYLPVVQKLTFLYVLGWICLICFRLYRTPLIRP